MHIAILVYGSLGDMRPHVVLGMALQRARHEVQVIAAPIYEARVRARNLAYFPLTVNVNSFAKELGVGIEPIPRKKLTADTLKTAIREITSDSETEHSAQRLGAKIRQEYSLAKAVRWVERDLAQGEQ